MNEIGFIGVGEGWVQWNIHDCAWLNDVAGRVIVLDAGARRIGFVLGWQIVAIQGAEEATVILEGRIEGTRNPVWINLVTVGLVELLVARVVYQDSIGCGRSTDDDAVHRVCLVLGASDIAIFVVMKVAD